MTTLMGLHTSLKTETNVPIPMRDGALLYADIYRPDSPDRVPVLLQRVPYNKSMPAYRSVALDSTRAASHGFAVVIQDTRGRYTSDGEFYPFLNEAQDGYDTIEWCAAQPWSTGKVGMFGRSYAGATQWLAATSRPPSLAAIVPGVTASDYYEGWTYKGGALELGFTMSWTLSALTLANLAKLTSIKTVPPETRDRLIEAIDGLDGSFRHLPLKDFPHLKELAPYFYDWLAHPSADDYWKRWRIEDHYGDMGVASLNVGGWHDIFLKGTLRNFQGMTEHGPTDTIRKGQKLLIGPWHHASPGPDTSGQAYFGLMASDPAIDLHGLHLRWYEYWLKGIDNGIMDEPPVRIFVMGENAWRYEQEWPLARTQYVDYYFHSDGKANTLNGDGLLAPNRPGGEPPDVFLYDPRDPVPTTGGALCCYPGILRPGAYDQREVEARSDVLVYTTPPLEADLEVTGPVMVTLYAASSSPDTDFTAKLVDVCPCGCTRSLTDGIIRARYRESLAEPKPIQPGDVYEYTIDLVATSNVFKAGHRVRVEVSSSNFPRFDRNPNTGRAPWEESELRPALQTVLHDDQHPSRIGLPVIPRG